MRSAVIYKADAVPSVNRRNIQNVRIGVHDDKWQLCSVEMLYIKLESVQFEQTLDYPTVELDIDREKAGLSGAKVDDVGKALVMATASTRSWAAKRLTVQPPM